MPAALAGPNDFGPAVRDRLCGFVRTLRDNGFRVGLAESQDALRLLATAGLDRPVHVRPALRALFCGRRSDWNLFDALFDAFWSGTRVKRRTTIAGSLTRSGQQTLHSLARLQQNSAQPSLPSEAERTEGDQPTEAAPSGRREGASRHESLARTDFRQIADPAALMEAHALAGRLARAMQARLTRRDHACRRGSRIDLRRTIRASLGTGGTPINLIHRRPRQRPLRLVVLIDASGSMGFYTAVFLRFVHGVLDQFREAEAFLFHTRLVHMSDALREKDAGRALDRLGLMADGVGGGTRIGESLATFNRWHAARVIHSRTCVMIMSDGYDTGDPELIRSGMAALRRRCRRIVWLNPLLGWDGYEPTSRGMAAALPFIDLFAAAHNIESLAALEPYLARL